MKEFLFDTSGLSDEEILENLTAECDKKEEAVFVKPLTKSELSELKTEYIEQQIILKKNRQKLKELSDPIKAEIKAINTICEGTIKLIKDGGREVREDLFGMADHESGMMNFYDNRARFVQSRRLFQEEKQARINFNVNGVGNG